MWLSSSACSGYACLILGAESEYKTLWIHGYSIIAIWCMIRCVVPADSALRSLGESITVSWGLILFWQ